MLANFNRLHVQQIGVTVTIPNDDFARLMYYLSCVDTVIEYDNEDDILTDYENYYLLNVEQKAVLLSLVTLFNPKIFINEGVFIVDPSLVPEGSDNEFYQITDERINFHFNNEIMIGGKTCKIEKVMACTNSWLLRFYYNPLNNIISLAEKLLPPPLPKSINYPKPTYRTEPNYMTKPNNMLQQTNKTKPKNEDCCCCII